MPVCNMDTYSRPRLSKSSICIERLGHGSEYASSYLTPRNCGPQYGSTFTVISPNKSRLHPGTKEAIYKISDKYNSLDKIRVGIQDLELDRRREPQEDVANDDSSQYSSSNDSACHSNSSASSMYGEDRAPPVPQKGIVTDQELLQVETLFRSHKTHLHVCPSIVHVYFTNLRNVRPRSKSVNSKSEIDSKTEDSSWKYSFSGIPVLVLDTGENRARTKRGIQIFVAERGTGFMLWKDTIDNLSNYSCPEKHFHTMYLSSDHTRLAGFSFDDVRAAQDFLQQVEELTADPANISLSGPTSKLSKKLKKRKMEKVKLPKKTDISQPCCFQHITRVDNTDRANLFSMTKLAPRPNIVRTDVTEAI